MTSKEVAHGCWLLMLPGMGETTPTVPAYAIVCISLSRYMPVRHRYHLLKNNKNIYQSRKYHLSPIIMIA
jgi:hypothetical protein